LRQIYTDGFTEKPFKIRKEKKKERKGKGNLSNPLATKKKPLTKKKDQIKNNRI